METMHAKRRIVNKVCDISNSDYYCCDMLRSVNTTMAVVQ
jgi:hypothetical protein